MPCLVEALTYKEAEKALSYKEKLYFKLTHYVLYSIMFVKIIHGYLDR